MSIEFFGNRSGRALVVNDINKNEYSNLCPVKYSDIIDFVYYKIKEDYSEAFESLQKLYPDQFRRKYIIVKRFLKCNFSIHDNVPDIDDDGNFIFEDVYCPLKGECPHDKIICNPKLNTNLSDRELQVVKLLVDDMSINDISNELCISPFTVENHRKRIYKKLSINKLSQLVNYVHKNKLI